MLPLGTLWRYCWWYFVLDHRTELPVSVTERDILPVVSYARISADQERDEHGIQHQHKVNRQTAERLGWTVVAEYTDNDKSAAKSGVVRDEFEAMLRALRTGEAPGRPRHPWDRGHGRRPLGPTPRRLRALR